MTADIVLLDRDRYHSTEGYAPEPGQRGPAASETCVGVEGNQII